MLSGPIPVGFEHFDRTSVLNLSKWRELPWEDSGGVIIHQNF